MRNKVFFSFVLVACLIMAAGSAFAAQIELITNGSFQNGDVNWDSWAGTRTIEGRVADINNFAPSDHCAKVTGGYRHIECNNPCAYMLTTTGVYHISGWFYIPSLDDGTGATSARMWMRYQSPSASVVIVDDTLTPVPSDPAKNYEIPIGVWTKKEFDIAMPANEMMQYFAFGVYGHIGDTRSTIAPTVYFDDLSITANYSAISGTVVDDLNQVVAGATVTLMSSGYQVIATTTTDATGSYAFTTQVPDGSYVLGASKVNYTSGDPVYFSPGGGGSVAPPITIYRVTTTRISGKVYYSENGVNVGLPGVVVTGTLGAGVVSDTTDANGNYDLDLAFGQVWIMSVKTPFGYKNLEANNFELLVSETGPVTQDFPLQKLNIPQQDQILLAVTTDTLPNSGATGPWSAAAPVGGSLTAVGTPEVEVINGTKWEKNLYADGDGYNFATFTDPIAVNGVSVVVATRPLCTGEPRDWTSVLDVFHGNLVLGFEQSTGKVRVHRNGIRSLSANPIVYGQPTVLSLVVQPDGQYKVWANGAQIMDITATSALTSLVPGGQEFQKWIRFGRGTDGWSVYNGNIGDMYFYKTALTDAERIGLETDLMSKFYGIAPWTITASAGAGGTISPVGATLVADGQGKTFTITPALGYAIADVLVDDHSVGAVSTYTFDSVTANHTITVSFSLLATQLVSGNVKGAGANLAGAKVFFSLTPNASVNPAYIATTDASGNYSQALIPATWYVCSAATGYVPSDDLTVTVASAPVPGVNFNMAASSRNIPVMDKLLFAAITEALPATQDASTGSWVAYYPKGLSLTPMATPTVDMISGIPWEKNQRGTGGDDGFLVGTYSAPVAIDGATIVAVVKPVYITIAGEPRGEIVDCFYGQLFMAVAHGTGEVIICRKGYQQTNTGYKIPNGQQTILSLVVQSDGSYRLFANGTQVASGAATGVDTYKELTPSGFNRINVGRNDPDGWSSFNGNIGDVFLYKVALTDAERGVLESDLTTKFGIVSTVSVSGKVVVAGTSPAVGVAGATVSVPGTSYTTTADLNGNYILWVGPNAHYSVTASAAGYTDNSIGVDVATTALTGKDIALTPPRTVSGIVTNGTTPIANAVVQMVPSGLLTGPAVVTNAAGQYFFTPEVGTYEIYADALGYAAKTQSLTVDAGSGAQTLNIILTPKVETGVIVNGGFEDVAGGKPTSWHDWTAGTDSFISATNVPGEFYSGTYGAKYTPASGDYVFLSQVIPVIPGSTYNVYWKMKGDACVETDDYHRSLFQFVNFRRADGSDIDPAIWIDYGGVAPTTWTQFPLTGPAVKVQIPTGAANLVLLFGKVGEGLNWAGKSIYVDDVVVDRVEPAGTSVASLAALKNVADGTDVKLTGLVSVICAPRNGARTTDFFYVGEAQGLGGLKVVDNKGQAISLDNQLKDLVGKVHKPAGGEIWLELTSASIQTTNRTIAPVGVNNKAAMTDAKIKTNAVRVWGRVKSVNSTTMVISDGYQSDITISVNGLSVTGIDNTKTAVVTGVVSMDGTVQAQAISF